MDRVLIAVDNNQFAGHLEMTLRKVGYDVESTSTEFNLSEKLLTFNPDIILARGQSVRLSALNIGKKLKEAIKFSGKVVLVMGQNQKMTPNDMTALRADLLLFEPVGAMGLTMQVLNLDPVRKKNMQEKLVRMAEIDTNFRQAEQSYLVQYGRDLDKELKLISGGNSTEKAVDEFLVNGFDLDKLSNKQESKRSEIPNDSEFEPRAEYLKALSEELIHLDLEMPLRIESYNHVIKNIDGDLHKGLSKRDTQNQQKKIHTDALKDPGQKVLDSIDKERQEYVNALMKQK